MKKMTFRRMCPFIIAGMLLYGCSVSVYATDVKPIGGDPFNVSSDLGTNETSVEFSIDPSYTVTIPEKIELSGSYGTVYTNTGYISTDRIFLEEGKKIVVSLTSESKFNMTTSTASSYQLSYTVSTESFGSVNKEYGGKVAEFATSTARQTAEMFFTTDEPPQYAGKYRDPVIFTITVK